MLVVAAAAPVVVDLWVWSGLATTPPSGQSLHWQCWPCGIRLYTEATCLPQPAQLVFPQVEHLVSKHIFSLFLFYFLELIFFLYVFAFCISFSLYTTTPQIRYYNESSLYVHHFWLTRLRLWIDPFFSFNLQIPSNILV